MRAYNSVTHTWTLSYLLTDHPSTMLRAGLGSMVAITDVSGSLISEQRYLPFGQVRADVGTIAETDFGYTGQRALPEMGLMDYKVRFYDSALGRFVQPDSIIPNVANLQNWNRFSYVLNNPISHNDPTGHYCADEDENGRTVKVDCGKNSRIGDDIDEKLSAYGVELQGDWNEKDKLAAYYAVRDAANRIAEANGADDPIAAYWSAYDITNESHQVLRMMASFEYQGHTYTAGGVTLGPHLIIFANLADPTYDSNGNVLRSPSQAFVEVRNNIVHELGHAFAQQ